MKPAAALLAPMIVINLTIAWPASAEWVRVPRDSPIMIHHQVQQPGSFDPATLSPPAPIRQRPRPIPPVSTPVFPDPGSRPIWVPDSYRWTGFELVRVPGHWVWTRPEWPLTPGP